MAHTPRVGEYADHKSGALDPRPVAKVQKRGRGWSIWLYLGGPQPYGPFPASNYTYTTRELESA